MIECQVFNFPLIMQCSCGGCWGWSDNNIIIPDMYFRWIGHDIGWSPSLSRASPSLAFSNSDRRFLSEKMWAFSLDEYSPASRYPGLNPQPTALCGIPSSAECRRFHALGHGGSPAAAVWGRGPFPTRVHAPPISPDPPTFPPSVSPPPVHCYARSSRSLIGGDGANGTRW